MCRVLRRTDIEAYVAKELSTMCHLVLKPSRVGGERTLMNQSLTGRRSGSVSARTIAAACWTPLPGRTRQSSLNGFLKLNSLMRTNGLKWTPDAMSNGLRSMNVVLSTMFNNKHAGDAAATAVTSAAQDDAYSDDTILAAADMDCIGDGV